MKRGQAVLGFVLAVAWGLAPSATRAQEPSIPTGVVPMQAAVIAGVDDLVGLSGPQLDQLYRQSGPGRVPAGKVRGRALYPDTRFGAARSRAAKAVWQGKVFRDDSTAVNRFFGLRMIEGRVYPGASWLDGNASMILDYQGTSRVYGSYRDEIREVAPNVYLGLMYARTEPTPTLKMYFAFAAQP